MSEASLNIHNPGGIRRGLVRQDRDINLHSVRLYPSLLSSHHPPSISPLSSVAVFTLQCRDSGPKMETRNVWKTLRRTLYQLHVFFYLTHHLLCENISPHWKHSQSPWAKLSNLKHCWCYVDGKKSDIFLMKVLQSASSRNRGALWIKWPVTRSVQTLFL